MDPDSKEFLETVLKAHRAGDREAMSMASVAAYVQNGDRMLHTGRRHDAQVDAQIKAKLAACGLEELYDPPEESTDEMGTMINCTFNGDETIQQLASVLGGSDGTENAERPAGPETPKGSEGPKEPPAKTEPATPTAKPSRWKRLTDFMLPLGAGAAITAGGFTLANMGRDTPKQDAYDIRALPWEPFPSQTR